MGKINRLYKDRLFKFIFGNPDNKEWTLSLYNAINKTNYDNANDIIINTIEDSVYMGMKNDVSFILLDSMNFWEQQSTFNPNMPVRILIYAGMAYSDYVNSSKFKIYSEKLQILPAPKCICFYNGTDKKEDVITLKLSDSFKEGKDFDIDVKVTMININFGRNKELLENCKPLRDYAKFVYDVRKINKTKNDIRASIDDALNEMEDNSVLKSYLMKNKAEVMSMCITEYDEEKHMKDMRAEFEEQLAVAVDNSIKQGVEEGKHNERVQMAVRALNAGCDESFILQIIDNDVKAFEEAKALISG